MRLLILSDLHREIWYRTQTRYKGSVDPCPKIDLSISRPDVVILAGDIDVGTRAVAWADQAFPGLPVVYVNGNHEGYGQKLDEVQDEISEACEATGHVHYLNRRELVIGSVRFLGAALWTDFKLYGKEFHRAAVYDAGTLMNDYRRIRLGKQGYRKLKPRDTEQWHFEDRTWLESRLAEAFDGKTVAQSRTSTRATPSPRPTRPISTGWLSKPISGCTVMSIPHSTTASAAVAWSAIRWAIQAALSGCAPKTPPSIQIS